MHHNALDNNTLHEMLKMTANENKKGLGVKATIIIKFQSHLPEKTSIYTHNYKPFGARSKNN